MQNFNSPRLASDFGSLHGVNPRAENVGSKTHAMIHSLCIGGGPMNFDHLSDQELHEETLKIHHQERRLLTNLIHHLRENERRRLFASFKCESLQDYLEFEIGYSEDQAWRRVDAIKLLEDLPELEEKINRGLHCLTNLNSAHALFKKEAEFSTAFTREEKLEILEAIEQTPTRAAQRMLPQYSSVPKELRDEKKHGLSMDELENNEKIQAKLEKLKGLLAHSNPNISTVDLIDKLCDLGIKSWDPGSAAPRKSSSKAAKYRAVWRKAKSGCENCGSGHALQIEHILPRALGGTDDPLNLKLLCRSCNQRSAIEVFGLEKMEKYLVPPKN
jgi:hypothetical protein